ncbi:MAG: hypothetical protein H0V72_09445 [Bradyrhizobium sp.]|nr:hypothetical protein [Bradyrhizobium sp.]
MEPFICDINNMATLAHDAVMEADWPGASKDVDSVAHFAVYHLIDMIRDLQARYRREGFERCGKAGE